MLRLSGTGQTQKDEYHVIHLYVQSKKAELKEAESRMVVARGWGWGQWGDVGQRVQRISYAE